MYETVPKFTPAHKCILKKYLTVDVFRKLTAVKTVKDFTLSNVIMTGAVIPEVKIGVVAGDEHSYSQFQELYAPIIKVYLYMLSFFSPFFLKRKLHFFSGISSI